MWNQGLKEGKVEMSRKMLDKGYSLDVVVGLSGLAKEDILEDK